MRPLPPRRAIRFLRWFCREDYLEEIEGDLTEIFEKEFEGRPAFARWKFFLSVLRYFRPSFLKTFRFFNPNPFAMLHHNLRITFRHFLRYKSSFAINMTGLTAGLATAMLVYLWVQDEVKMDKFNLHDDRLFQIMRIVTQDDNEIEVHDHNSDLLAPALKAEWPAVDEVVGLRDMPPILITSGDKLVKANLRLADRNFFKVFNYPLLSGNVSNVLNDKSSIVISEQLALKLFPSVAEAIGRELSWIEKPFADTYHITGVFQSQANSSDRFDFVISLERFHELNKANSYWDSNTEKVYITLKAGIDPGAFNTQIKDFVKKKFKEQHGTNGLNFIGTLFIRKFSDAYLFDRYENGVQDGGRIDYVVLFTIVGVFILLIACINFMNLSTARGSRRSKEVGIKKSVGATRSSLIKQHIGEAIVLSVLSMLVAIGMVWLLLPAFNFVTAKSLRLEGSIGLITGAAVITLVAGLVAGSYPAFYLTAFKPADVLKGKLVTSFGGLFARRGLVVFQFFVSIVLIVSVIVVYQQIEFVHNRNLGFNKENVLAFERVGKLHANADAFLSELKNVPGVTHVSTMGYVMGSTSGGTGGVDWEGKKGRIEFSRLDVDFDLMEMLNMKLKEGRSFSREFSSEDKKVVLNETAVRQMGLSDPVGKTLTIWGTQFEIIGVVKDFHFESLYEEMKPCYFQLSNNNRHIVVRLDAGSVRETVGRIDALYRTFNPGIPFDFNFLDDSYSALYQSETRVAKLSRYFAAVAVIISCLGLFGLVAFTAERRMKEISVRKVFGASEFSILRLLSGDFIKMVLVSVCVAIPVSYFLADWWLSGFAFHVDLAPWFFAASAMAALAIALATVLLQTFTSAKVNPAHSLKND